MTQTPPHLARLHFTRFGIENDCSRASKNGKCSSMFFDSEPKATWASIWGEVGLHFGCLLDSLFVCSSSSERGCRKLNVELLLDQPCEFIVFYKKSAFLAFSGNEGQSFRKQWQVT